jgi:hypothetical protein
MFCFSACLFAFTAQGARILAAPPITLPLVMLGKSPAFHALVDGHDALLELDTGSFELRLSPDFVRKNNPDLDGVTLKIGSSEEQRFKPIIDGLGEPENPTLADTLEPKPDGIVGLDVIRNYAVGLDLIDGQISFWPGGKVGTETANQWTSTNEDRRLKSLTKIGLSTRSPEDWFLIEAKINGNSLKLVFDTGTYVSSVNPSFVSQLGLRKIAETEVDEIGHTEVLPVMVANSLTFGQFQATFPVVNVESENDPDSDGILGTESLGYGKFLIDMPDLTLYGRRSNSMRALNPLERRLIQFGIQIFPDPKGRFLVLVQPGSRADRSGIRSGDWLVAIGKLDLDEISGNGSSGTQQDPQARFKMGMALLQRKLSLTTRNSSGAKTTIDLPSVQR